VCGAALCDLVQCFVIFIVMEYIKSIIFIFDIARDRGLMIIDGKTNYYIVRDRLQEIV